MASMQDATFFCIPSSKLPYQERVIYCGLCLASAGLGFLGAMWQIYQWKPLTSGYKHRRKPSPNPMIVFSLALADLLACSGVIARSATMMMTDPPRYNHTIEAFIPLHSDETLIIFSLVIEALGQFFYGATFMWTVTYAVDTYLQLSNRTIPTIGYHMLCWGLPAITTTASFLPFLIGHNMLISCVTGYRLVLHYVFYNSLIIVALAGDPILYIMCNGQISKRMRESGLINSHNRAIMSALRRKFLSVILIFTICWLPNMVDFVIETVEALSRSHPASLAKFFPLWVIEAILNPLQGLLNCFVYGRHMLFRRIARNEGRITTGSDDVRENTPILNTRKDSEDYL